MRRLLSVLLLAICLCGCENPDSPRDMFDRYQQRLSNALQLPAAEAPEPALGGEGLQLRYPSRRLLRMPLQQSSLNLLDFLRLSDCDLQRLLGERNSSLGKLMTGSQQLIYHRQFLYLGDLCLRALAADSERAGLRLKLQQAMRLKREDATAVAWNASAASEEFQQLLSLAGGALERGAADSFPGQLVEALGQLGRVLRSSKLLQSATLEQTYQVLGSDSRAGRLLRSQQLVVERLNILTAAVEERLRQRPLCLQPRPTPQAKVAREVFMRFYIGEVQPYLSGLHRQTEAIQRELWRLLAPLQPWPSAFEEYWAATWSDAPAQSMVQRFDAAIAGHTRLWQRLLKQCGMSPGGGSVAAGRY